MKFTKPALIILVGNIASGKSTLARSLHEKKGYFCLSLDSFRYMLGAGKYVFDKKIEKGLGTIEIEFLRWLMDKRVNILVDDAKCVNEFFRRFFIQEARNYGYLVKCIELPKYSKKFCVGRRMQNPHCIYDRKIWEGVWDKMDYMYIQPSKEEGFDKITRLRNSDEVKEFVKNL